MHATRRAPEIENDDIQRVDLSRFRGKIDLVYGGPPCQPFSSGGHRKANGDARNMVPAFIGVLGRVRPDVFLMENVPGLVVGERRAYLRSVLDELEELGYELALKVVNAADYGVPQKRRRLFVVGMRGRTFRFPEETHGAGRAFPHVAVKDVLPTQPIGEPNPSKVFYARNPDLRPSPYDGHVFNGGGARSTWNSPAIPSWRRREGTRPTSSTSSTSCRTTIGA